MITKHLAQEQKTALQRFKTLLLDEDQEPPIERLRFFCSLAMNGQDWLDVEPFLDAIAAPQPPRRQPMTEAERLIRWHAGFDAHRLESAFDWFSAGIRSAETHHGIGAQHDR